MFTRDNRYLKVVVMFGTGTDYKLLKAVLLKDKEDIKKSNAVRGALHSSMVWINCNIVPTIGDII